jgi:hypothetical protein
MLRTIVTLLALFASPHSNETEFPDMYINRRDGDAGKAIFCLAPTGLGFGVRVYHAMADGCIPLVISDNVTQPWEGDFLPYSLFAVRLPESDIPRCAVPCHSYVHPAI